MAVEVVVEGHRAAAWADAITGRVGDVVRVLAVDGERRDDPDISAAEIAVSGWADPERVGFAEILRRMDGLRWIHSVSAGLDDFVSVELAQRGLVVTSSGEAYAQAVAEHALGAMIMTARGFPQMLRNQLEGRWEFDRAGLEEAGLGRLLCGRLVGIVGFGRVGRHLAAVCRRLDMRVWGLRRTPGLVSEVQVERLLGPPDLGELLASSDFVVLCASLNRSTQAMIGAAELEAMKRSAVLVNVGRGGLVDQAALVDGLGTGEIAAAALDVTTPEPLPRDHDLWRMANAVITPHVAGESAESAIGVVEIFLDNLELYLAGEVERMQHRVTLSAHL